MAAGGLRGLSPMQPVAQVVSPNTSRRVGDRGGVPESYIPYDGSARSMGILLQTMRAMGVTAIRAGGPPGSYEPVVPVQIVQSGKYHSYDPTTIARAEVDMRQKARDTYGG